MRKEGYGYQAFITYSNHDRVVAKWLHKKLENYRVPKEIVGSAGRDGPIPRRIFPVFRDRDELPTAPDLPKLIREALAQSAYLIVLCSPAAAKSRWVNLEIIEYKKLGRGDRIHAIIVNGEPNAPSQDHECYPAALRFDLGPDGQLDPQKPVEPLAADLRDEGDGKSNALLKLIAGMFGIRFEALRKREAAAARRRLLLWQSVTASIVLLAMLGGGAAWLASDYRQRSLDARIPGIRIEKRDTVLDLSGWQPTTEAELNTVKKSLVVSRNTFSIVRTGIHAPTFVHVAGTSSSLTPEVHCDNRCRMVPRTSADGRRTPNEWNIEFDISGYPLDERREIKFEFHFWNAFQKPQEWGGFRVLHATDVAIYSIRFPERRRPQADSLGFFYVESKEREFDKELRIKIDKDAAGLVKELSWEVQNPSADRSYRVKWTW